jgi:hypothetical protein
MSFSGYETISAHNAAALPPSSELRPQFMAGVVAPFAQYAVHERLKEFHALLSNLPEADWAKVPAYVNGNDVNWDSGTDRRQWSPIDVTSDALNAAHFGLRTIASREVQQSHFNTPFEVPLAPDLFSLITPPQQKAFEEFVRATPVYPADYDFADGLVSGDMSTITDTLSTIHTRHPELGLDRGKNLVEFLRLPEIPAVLRGFMGGGNGFPDGIKGFNFHPVTAEYRNDRRKPVIRARNDGSYRAHPDLLRVALQHRASTAAVSAADIAARRLENSQGFQGTVLDDGTRLPFRESPPRSRSDDGVRREAFYASSGCPMRRIVFTRKVAELDAAGIGLTPEQLSVITSGPNPLASLQNNGKQVVINHDGIRAATTLLAEVLESQL